MASNPKSLHQLPPGTLLQNRYQIDQVLGEGGFGITYLGTDRMLEMTVAVKEFYPHGYAVRNSASSLQITLVSGQGLFDKWRERFLTEARTLAKCTNVPSIVQVRDFFEENNTAYIVMEYLSGCSLQDYIMQNGIIPADRMFSYMIPLVRDLDNVHRLGLIHRDISPDNIMLMPDDTLKLFDFGAARYFSDEEHRTLSIMLKPGYAPEEQYRTKGVQGAWTDIYAICATIYKCITGVTPPDSLERINEDELRTPADLGCGISAGMEQVLLKGMSIRAEDRYQNAASLADAMENSMKDPAAESSCTHGVTVAMENLTEERKDDLKEAVSYAEQETDRKTVSSRKQDEKAPHRRQEPEEAGTADTIPAASGNSSTKKKKRILPGILAAALVVIALICILILTTGQRPATQTRQTSSADTEAGIAVRTETEQNTPMDTSATDQADDTDADASQPNDANTDASQPDDTSLAESTAGLRMTDGDYEPVSGKSLLDSALWGFHSFSGDDSSLKYMDITTDYGTLNVSEFPIAFLINPAWNKTEPLICMCFIDQFEYLYFVFGTYSTNNRTLQISAPALVESLPQFNAADILDNIALLNDGNYTCESGSSYPSEDRAYVLQDTIQFSWSLSTSNQYGHLVFNNNSRSITYISGYPNSEHTKDQILCLQGTASSPDRLYQEMDGLNLVYDPAAKKAESITIYFADGGHSLDAAVSTFYSNIEVISLKTTQISRSYNGRIEKFSENKSFTLRYINCYPYGFILYSDNNQEYYYYQTPVIIAE